MPAKKSMNLISRRDIEKKDNFKNGKTKYLNKIGLAGGKRVKELIEEGKKAENAM